MAPKRLLLLAASVVAALDSDAPASLVADCINWVHLTHSMKQAFDVLRELRACGLPAHAWP